jgi:hypothetical protein
MESESAAAVVISASGQTSMATVAAGTRTPPTPSEAIHPRATTSFSFSGVMTASAPANPVISNTASSRTSRVWFGKADSPALKPIAPIAVIVAGPSPLRPICTGMGSYTLEKVTGKKFKIAVDGVS